MESKFIKDIIKKSLKTNIIVTAIIFCISCVGIWYHFSYIKSFFSEPVKITSSQEATDNLNGGRNYVQVYSESLYDAFYEIETITKKNGIETGRKLTSFFVFTELDDGKIMLIELPYSYMDDEEPIWDDLTLKGVLKKEPKSIDVFDTSSEYIGSLFGMDKESVRKEILVDVYLDTIAYDTFETSSTLTVLSIFGFIMSLLYCIYLVILLGNYKNHKLYRQLKKYGESDVVENCIQREYDNRVQTLIASNSDEYIFNTYIISGSKKQIRLTSDLIWAYKKTIRSNSGKSYCIKLSFKSDEKPVLMSISSEGEADRVLNDIQEKLPVICDYDKSLEKMYDKNKPEFLAHYEKYKTEFNTRKSMEESVPAAESEDSDITQ